MAADHGVLHVLRSSSPPLTKQTLLPAAYLHDHVVSYKIDISTSPLPLSSLRHPFLPIFVQVEVLVGGTETESEESFAVLTFILSTCIIS